jgi:hypothetical protein
LARLVVQLKLSLMKLFPLGLFLLSLKAFNHGGYQSCVA